MSTGRADADVGYCLVTAAHDEVAHIPATLEAVVRQTVRPRRWVVVSDGSTDGTDAIVGQYAQRHPFIALERIERRGGHAFAAKVHALRRGLECLAEVPHDFVGVLDADVWMDRDYFERLLGKFRQNPRLGIGGGLVEQHVDGVVVPRIKDLESVAGAVQLVRRTCMAQTGGLPALRYGGEDVALEVSARMHGWETRTFPELRVGHHGLVGAGAGGPLRARFKWGRMTFSLGYHPLYELARCGHRAIERPFVVGSAAELAGFLFALGTQRRPDVDRAFVQYLRHEQMTKLRQRLLRHRARRSPA